MATASQASKVRARPRAAVIGGGWAGFGAAWNLSKARWDVTLIDASPSPGGVAGRGAGNKGIELGVKGFWRHYANMSQLLERDLGLPVESVYGDYSETAFYSPRGKEVVAPVFGSRPRLPAPLGPLVWTSDRFTDLPISSRLSAFPLTQALLEFDLDEKTYAAYDSVSFEKLCKIAKVSDKLYETFLRPILLALLFVPPKDLSAATALSVLQNYVLAHQNDFDVRWPKKAPSEIFARWRAKLEESGASVMGSTRAKRVVHDGRRVTGVEIEGAGEGGDGGRIIEADAVILAAGAAALPKIVQASGLQACPGLSRVSELSCSAVTAVWLENAGEPILLEHPSNVFDGGANLAGTFYDIGSLRGEDPGRVFEVDTYNASDLIDLSEEDLVSAALEVLALAKPGERAFRSMRVSEGGAQIARVKNAAFRWIPGATARRLRWFRRERREASKWRGTSSRTGLRTLARTKGRGD